MDHRLAELSPLITERREKLAPRDDKEKEEEEEEGYDSKLRSSYK
jgi:hypothetical protein